MSDAADQRLADAVRAGDESAVSRALAEGADPDTAAARFQGSVLIEAARGGALEVAKLLVNAGARIGPIGQFKVSPLRAGGPGVAGYTTRG